MVIHHKKYLTTLDRYTTSHFDFLHCKQGKSSVVNLLLYMNVFYWCFGLLQDKQMFALCFDNYIKCCII